MAFAFTSLRPPIAAASAERLFFLSNGQVLQSCIYKPEGQGPFPTVVFNQPASRSLPAEGRVDPFPKLAKFYTSNGYALFVTGRHTSTSRSDSPDDTDRDNASVEGHEKEADIILSAISALKAQSFVDAGRIYVTGFSAGATTTLLLAEKNVDVRGYVVFSPASQVWGRSSPIREMLRRSVTNATAPIFLIQPQNDFNLGPSEVLGKILAKKGSLHRSKVFPPYGKNQKEANHFATVAPEMWGAFVLAFFKEITP